MLDGRPIVFLGPSLARSEAEAIVAADFRPPVRRGDLELIAAGRVVAIIDGVFDQDLSVSPTEIRKALARGVRVLGSASMGALRAAEVPEMEGFGRVYQMFRDKVIEDDDEVALSFHPETFRPSSEPMVNIRHAVERLRRPGTIDEATAQKILKSAKRLHYRDRAYPIILREAGLAERADSAVLQKLLRQHDLKREDAISLLERLPRFQPGHVFEEPLRGSLGPAPVPEVQSADAPVFLWEYGESVPFADIVLLLKMSGEFPAVASRAVARLALSGKDIDYSLSGGPDPNARARSRILQLRTSWGWNSSEESRVTLRDLGAGEREAESWLEDEVARELAVMALARENGESFKRAVRGELILNELGLKRAAIRAGSLKRFAERSPLRNTSPGADETQATQRLIAHQLDTVDWPAALQRLSGWGVSQAQADGFIALLCQARRGLSRQPVPVRQRKRAWRSLGLRSRRKRQKASRAITSQVALALSKRLSKVVGITRVGLITGLDITGIPNASAYRPTGEWSSTIGSGKSTTVAGAKIGAIMEEVETWAQEQFPAEAAGLRERESSYEQLARRQRCVDPARLDLPHDTCYRPSQVIGWLLCHDLVTGRKLWVPSAALRHRRLPNDIFFSPWVGRKVFTTNGLASGFTLEEALLHALCEVVERHATVVDEVVQSNPGAPVPAPMRWIDLQSTPPSTRRLISHLERAGKVVLRDITSEVRVPSVRATVALPQVEIDPAPYPVLHHGYATHPDAETAANQALLEASQSMVVNIAGAREDLTLFARSLGRHDRTVGSTRKALRRVLRPQTPAIPLSSIGSLRSNDILQEIDWVVTRLLEAGVSEVLVADLSLPSIRPARVVRVLIPDLETPSSVRTGERIRAHMLHDLLSGLPAAKE